MSYIYVFAMERTPLFRPPVAGNDCIKMSRVPHTNASHATYQCVTRHISNESCATYQMSHLSDIHFCRGNARLCFVYLVQVMTA